jgi:hypothetical protein
MDLLEEIMEEGIRFFFFYSTIGYEREYVIGNFKRPSVSDFRGRWIFRRENLVRNTFSRTSRREANKVPVFSSLWHDRSNFAIPLFFLQLLFFFFNQCHALGSMANYKINPRTYVSRLLWLVACDMYISIFFTITYISN